MNNIRTWKETMDVIEEIDKIILNNNFYFSENRTYIRIYKNNFFDYTITLYINQNNTIDFRVDKVDFFDNLVKKIKIKKDISPEYLSTYFRKVKIKMIKYYKNK